MARTNHTMVKKYAASQSRIINDETFFTSPMMASYFEDIAEVITKKYRPKEHIYVRIDWDKSPNAPTAYTDHKSIYLNAGCQLVLSQNTRQDRFLVLTGMFDHELAHLLYSDQKYKLTVLEQIDNGLLTPEPDVPFPKTKDFLLKNNRAFRYAYKEVYNSFRNAIEDGYIENRFLDEYPRCSDGMKKMRSVFYDTIIDNLKELKKKETEEDSIGILGSIFSLVLSYAKYGCIKVNKYQMHDERVQACLKCMEHIDFARTITDSENHFMEIHNVVAVLEDYILDYIQSLDIDPNCSDEDILASLTSFSEVISSLETSDSTDDTEPLVPVPNSAETELSENENTNNMGEFSDFDTAKSNDDTSESTELNESKAETHSPFPVTDEKESFTPKESEDQKEIMDSIFNEGNLYKEDISPSGYEQVENDTKRILNKMAEQKAASELETQRTRTLNTFANNIYYGDIHAGCTCTVKRIASVNNQMISDYEKIIEPLKEISRRLQRGVRQVLKDKKNGGKITGLYMGNRLNSPSLLRNDGRYFSKNKLLTETPKLAISCLVDESGSMSTHDRCTYARATAVVIEDFCRNLEIPLAIYGHTTGERTSVDLYSYVEFDQIDGNDRYRLMDISARNCNRDGYALRFAAERLLTQDADIKLLILVSDGSPNAENYSGIRAYEDLRNIKNEYRRKGIILFAAAIGDDKDIIEEIYGDAFLDISDLNGMPVKMINLIKKFIK